MPTRSILVPLVLGDRPERRLDAILPLARRMGAHLDLILFASDAAEILAFSISGIVPSAVVIDKLRSESERLRRKTADWISAWRDCRGVSAQPTGTAICANFREQNGAPERGVVKIGRLADLIVFDRPVNEPLSGLGILDAALFETGRPVLLLPPDDANAHRLPKRIAIGWNGTLQAARAVMSGMDLLGEAEHVLVVAEERSGAFEPDGKPDGDLCDTLQRRGITATLIPMTCQAHETTGQALLRHALEHQSDMLMIGAYTHSRLRQYMLGGVTRHALSNATIPLFVAH